MDNVKIVPIGKLKPHERINRRGLKRIKENIILQGLIIEPAVVDKDNWIILDGHHRVQALKELGYKKVPVFLVDYVDSAVRVVSRRVGFRVTKETVIRRALSGRVFPFKTTKHFIPNRPRRANISLKLLA